MKKTILAAVAAATLMLGTVGCTIEAPTDSTAKGSSNKADDTTDDDDGSFFDDTSDESDEPDKPDTYKPTKNDFKAKLKITGSDCFGSAGCLLDYKIGLTWLGPSGALLDKSYDVYYRVTGGDDGGTSGTITVTPKLRYAVVEGYGSTAEGGALDVQVVRIGNANGF